VQAGNYFFLSQDPSLSYDQITIRRTVGDVSLSGVCQVGLCPLEFRKGQVAGQWYVPGCELYMDVRCAFTCAEGFDYLRVTGRFRRFPPLSNDVIETELKLAVQFEADRKRFTPSLRMRVKQVDACMTPYVRLVDGGSLLAITGAELYGWKVQCSVDDRFEVLLATSLDPLWNRELTGEADYWEAWKLRGALGSCCGRDFVWTLAVYFEENAASLFDWGRTTALVEIPLAERLTAHFGTELGVTSPHWRLNAGIDLGF
jgi:hypothetical protein